jgi:serine/threonine-protein kinase
LREALPRQERAFNTTVHPILAFTHDVLGKLALKRGNLAVAEAEFRRCVEINKSLLGERDYKTAITMSNLASVLVKEGRYLEAERLVRTAVAALTEKPLPGNMNVGIAHMNLGRALLGEKRFKDAEKSLLAAYEVLKNETGKPTIIQEARTSLAEVYDALKQPESAARYRAALAAAK